MRSQHNNRHPGKCEAFIRGLLLLLRSFGVGVGRSRIIVFDDFRDDWRGGIRRFRDDGEVVRRLRDDGSPLTRLLQLGSRGFEVLLDNLVGADEGDDTQ
jgi:hypothetical protein